MDIVQLLDENSKMKIKLLELIQTKLGERVEISFLAQKTGISKFKLSKLIHELKMENVVNQKETSNVSSTS